MVENDLMRDNIYMIIKKAKPKQSGGFSLSLPKTIKNSFYLHSYLHSYSIYLLYIVLIILTIYLLYDLRYN